MTANISSNPLAYMGVDSEVNPGVIVASRAPTTTDNAPIGTLWVNKSADTVYCLTSVSGSSTWTVLS